MTGGAERETADSMSKDASKPGANGDRELGRSVRTILSAIGRWCLLPALSVAGYTVLVPQPHAMELAPPGDVRRLEQAVRTLSKDVRALSDDVSRLQQLLNADVPVHVEINKAEYYDC